MLAELGFQPNKPSAPKVTFLGECKKELQGVVNNHNNFTQFSSYVFTTLTPVRNLTFTSCTVSQENCTSQVVDQKNPEKFVSTCIGMEIDREWGKI